MLTEEIRIRVRYCDTDAMGVVHHSNYVNFYESARTEMLRSYGTTYKTLEESGVMLPVLEVGMKYFSPAFYDDLLTVKITLEERPAVRMKFRHEIYNQAGTLINTGTVVLAFVDAVTRRPCRAPKWFLDVFDSQVNKKQ